MKVSAAFSNLKNFNSESNLKKAAYSFISQQLLSKKDKDEFKAAFDTLDDDKNGCLTKDEFFKGHKEFFGESLPLEEVEELYNQADIDGDGTIQYSEFVLAAKKKEEAHSE